MEYFDNFFDKVFIDTLAHKLMSSKWSADNTANRNSWPYNKMGSHKFLGQTFFTRKSDHIFIQPSVLKKKTKRRTETVLSFPKQ